ncbi:hypothetical protein F5X99DRAFT_408589 [Biscogniauxia marginata]|nr:hypothetical protein F5X99DRAFT_408589 [Biscogniauxia marginata]
MTRTYAGYLFESTSSLSLPECTRWPEEQATKVRQHESRASFDDVGYPTPPPNHDQALFQIWDPATECKQSLSAKPWTRKVGAANGNVSPRSACIGGAVAQQEEECWPAGLSDNNPITDHTTKLDLQDALTMFAQNAGSILVAEQFNRNISHFISLVFIAACCAALYRGHSKMIWSTVAGRTSRSYEKGQQRASPCNSCESHSVNGMDGPTDRIARRRSVLRPLSAVAPRQDEPYPVSPPCTGSDSSQNEPRIYHNVSQTTSDSVPPRRVTSSANVDELDLFPEYLSGSMRRGECWRSQDYHDINGFPTSSQLTVCHSCGRDRASDDIPHHQNLVR